MTYERKEFTELTEKNRKSLNGEKPTMEYLAQAQIKMEHLTGNPHWEIFLSYLQSALERITDQAEQARNALCDNRLVDSNTIMATKLLLADLNGQIKAINAVIGLPKEIMESGEKAKERLGDLG